MSIAVLVLVCLGCALVVVWLLSAISVVAGIRRRAVEAGKSDGGRSSLADVPMVLKLSFGLTINVLTFAAAIVWYRLRGKPLPPPPGPGS